MRHDVVELVNDMPIFQEKPRDALADITDDFVGDCAGGVGKLGGGTVAFAAQKDNLVANLHVIGGGDVQHTLVHADAADDGRGLLVDGNLPTSGKTARQTVSITDGHGGKATSILRDKGSTIADSGVGRDGFHH